jgi:hypothetical protein
MQIVLHIKNPNFKKPSRNLSNRIKVKTLNKKFFGYLSKKFGSAYAQSHRNFENLRRADKDLI